jgi:hypothetical protein
MCTTPTPILPPGHFFHRYDDHRAYAYLLWALVCYLKDGKKTKDLLGRRKLERKYYSGKQHLVYASRGNQLGHG